MAPFNNFEKNAFLNGFKDKTQRCHFNLVIHLQLQISNGREEIDTYTILYIDAPSSAKETVRASRKRQIISEGDEKSPYGRIPTSDAMDWAYRWNLPAPYVAIRQKLQEEGPLFDTSIRQSQVDQNDASSIGLWLALSGYDAREYANYNASQIMQVVQNILSV
jgi:hypothetical protein